MKKFLPPFSIDKPKGYHVEGSTLTIPNLAPSLIEIIASSSSDGLPYSSIPQFDDDESSGLARVKSRTTLNEVFDFGNEQSSEHNEEVSTNEEVQNVEIIQNENS